MLRAHQLEKPGNLLPPLSGAAGFEPQPPGRRACAPTNWATDAGFKTIILKRVSGTGIPNLVRKLMRKRSTSADKKEPT